MKKFLSLLGVLCLSMAAVAQPVGHDGNGPEGSSPTNLEHKGHAAEKRTILTFGKRTPVVVWKGVYALRIDNRSAGDILKDLGPGFKRLTDVDSIRLLSQGVLLVETSDPAANPEAFASTFTKHNLVGMGRVIFLEPLHDGQPPTVQWNRIIVRAQAGVTAMDLEKALPSALITRRPMSHDEFELFPKPFTTDPLEFLNTVHRALDETLTDGTRTRPDFSLPLTPR